MAPSDTAFSAQLPWLAFKWLIIMAIWGIFTFGTWREDRRLRRLRGERLESADISALLQMLHQRNVQMGILLFLLIVVTAINDVREEMDRSAPHATVTAAAPPSTAATQNASASEKNVPAIPASPLGVPYSDITEFNEKDSRQQAYLDWLKERYETWLVMYYYLQKCNKADAKDIDVIRGSLEKRLTAVRASPAIEDNIFMAANGSFNEMYKSIPCDDAHLSLTKSIYDANLQQITGTVAPALGAHP